jgi:hypothetical protein
MVSFFCLVSEKVDGSKFDQDACIYFTSTAVLFLRASLEGYPDMGALKKGS